MWVGYWHESAGCWFADNGSGLFYVVRPDIRVVAWKSKESENAPAYPLYHE